MPVARHKTLGHLLGVPAGLPLPPEWELVEAGDLEPEEVRSRLEQHEDESDEPQDEAPRKTGKRK